MLFGTRPLMEAISSGKDLEKVFVQKGIRSPVFKEMMQMLKDAEIPYQFVPLEKLNRLTRKNHQGVVAIISPIIFHNLEQLLPGIFESGRDPLVLILDKITDVRNFGAILRTASCTGVDAVVIPSKNSAQLNAETIKSSAGALFKVPLCRSENLKLTLEFLSSSGLKLVAATEKSDVSIFEQDMSGPLGVIMGSEGSGVSGEYLKRADTKVMIPMQGEIASLNVSVAAGVMLYEVFRQRLA